MIEYGEIKSKLGVELEIYAQESWEQFFSQLYQVTQLIQPAIFFSSCCDNRHDLCGNPITNLPKYGRYFLR